MASGPIVGLLTVELQVTDAATLKEKRQVVKSLVDRISDRFNVSIAEVGHLGNCRRALLAAAAVGNETAHVSRVTDAVLRFIESDPRAVVAEAEVEVL